jgi:SAM-dependent methyltransferase
MDDWIDYYDSAHSIYVNDAHRKAHFDVIAGDIRRYIPSPDAVVLDYSCGEALSAGHVTAACQQLILAEPAPSVRARLAARFAGNGKIKVVSLTDLAGLPEQSVDLVVMISVAQYMTPADLDAAFALVRRLLKPAGTFLLGDILDPRVGAVTDVTALLKFAAARGFLVDAVIGIARMALSNYRTVRQKIGLQHYSEADMLAKLKAAGFGAKRAPQNVGYNPARMTFVAS